MTAAIGRGRGAWSTWQLGALWSPPLSRDCLVLGGHRPGSTPVSQPMSSVTPEVASGAEARGCAEARLLQTPGSLTALPPP